MPLPITFQLQIDNPGLHYTERDLYIMLQQMYVFADALRHNGNVRCQMYIGENSYNGEPLEVKS